MWRLITILAIPLACGNAFGQGKISFANDSSRPFVLGSPPWPDPSGPIPSSPLPSGLSLVAVLYAGTSSGTLALQTSVVLSGANWLTDGRMANKNLVLPFAGGSPCYFQVFLMDDAATRPNTIPGGAGRPYFVGATYFGTSGLFTAIPGTGLVFPNLATGASSTWPAIPIDAAGCLECTSPWFLTNPSNAVANAGTDVKLTAYALGPAPPTPNGPLFAEASYQWRKQGSPITGATNSSLLLTNVTLNDGGSYDVLAAGIYGISPSAPAIITVFVPAIAATLGAPAYTANNRFQFSVTGSPGSNYAVQVTTNLSTPSAWTSVFTNTSPFTFVDSNAQNFSQRFYRAQAR